MGILTLPSHTVILGILGTKLGLWNRNSLEKQTPLWFLALLFPLFSMCHLPFCDTTGRATGRETSTQAGGCVGVSKIPPIILSVLTQAAATPVAHLAASRWLLPSLRRWVVIIHKMYHLTTLSPPHLFFHRLSGQVPSSLAEKINGHLWPSSVSEISSQTWEKPS